MHFFLFYNFKKENHFLDGMVQMYLDMHNRTALEIDGNQEIINQWLRAKTTNDDKQAAETFLERLRTMRSTRDISRLVPQGELILADAGHYNPQYNSNEGKLIPTKRKERTFEEEVIPLEGMLFGSPIIGSSSHVW